MNRQEAIKVLDSERKEYIVKGCKLDKAIDVAIEALKKQTVYEQVKWERDVALQTLEEHGIGLGQKSDWIPVSERLPEKNGEYIVSLEDAVDARARFFNGKWFMPLWGSIAREYGEYEVIAWMPLPEPYKGGDTE